MSTVDWRKYFPYTTAREIQGVSLDVLFDNWNKFDVFVLQAPTAYGKTGVAKTLMNVFHNVSVITPTNLLVDQFVSEFPDTRTLKRMDRYYCKKWDRSCVDTNMRLKRFCSEKKDGPEHVCQCALDLAQAKYRKGPGIYNYHIFNSHRLHRQVFVADEAHNLIKFVQDLKATKIWQHDYKYPSNMYSTEQMTTWLKSLPEQQRKHKKIKLLENALLSVKPEYIPERGEEEFNGKGTVRGQPEMRDCIRLLPVDVREACRILWPHEVTEKIVLLSATINQHDIEEMGLGRRKVLYISCESPIPHSQRPIYLNPVAHVSRGNLVDATEVIARHVEKEILCRHIGEKGIIHATYQQARILKSIFTSDRFMFHESGDDKKLKYQQFRDSRPEEGKVLVASGMYEGIDLPEDLGRFQVVTKIPWVSLGSPAIRYKAEQCKEWYDWETLRSVIQACGRICRTPEDFGVTYILDGTIFKLLDRAIDLCPPWWRDALIDCRD